MKHQASHYIDQDLEKNLVKGQIANIWDFVGQKHSVTITHLFCHQV